MELTAAATINELRQAIYVACGVAGYSKGYRTRKLRKVCPFARGLDLRRKQDVVALATYLGLIQSNVIHVDFGQKAA
ncbi:MAG: hypothetical protein F6K00_19435 [Leptolyngbya sp. SIOISBB]|nr:hypothetical protein [Leptolyngbya sp. SIOISBB]